MTDELPYSICISDILTLREEILEPDSNFMRQISLSNVESNENTLESNPKMFFDSTFMTDALESSLKQLRNTVDERKDSNRQVFYGPYGTGKSHSLVTLYHCFKSTEIASTWANETIIGFEKVVPDDALPIAVPLQEEQPEFLWHPFFDRLNFEYGNSDGFYPLIKSIQDAIGGRSVALFIDGIGDWLETLEHPAKQKNLYFLQELFGASHKETTDLSIFVTFDRRNSTFQDILEKESGLMEISTSHIEKNILYHRLIKSIDKSPIMLELVQEYLEAYMNSGFFDISDSLRKEMYEAYPLHPSLMNTLGIVYSEMSGVGTIQGMLRLLSKVLRDNMEKVDIVTHSEIDFVEYNDELTCISDNYSNMDWYHDIINSLSSERNSRYVRSILNTVLLYSLIPDHSKGANLEEIIFGTYQRGDDIEDILGELDRLNNESPHLQQCDSKYYIRE